MLRVFLIFCLTVLAIAAAFLFQQTRRFSRSKAQLHDLAAKGCLTPGVVLKKTSRRLGKTCQYSLDYAFTAPDGKRYRSTVAVAPYIWHCYEPGSAIDITFLPASPSINSPDYLVSAVRKMLCAP